MDLHNTFEVPLPPDQAWTVLLDIPRIAPCMPGAELTEVVDDKTYKGKCGVKLGPIALTFNGVAAFDEIDAAAHTAKVKAQGTDTKGRGGASAQVVFRLEPAGSGSKVVVDTKLDLSGSVAQYGRGTGMIQAVASQLIGQFARNLGAELKMAPPVEVDAPVAGAVAVSVVPASSGSAVSAAVISTAPVRAAAKPISGFALLWAALKDVLAGMFGGRKRN